MKNNIFNFINKKCNNMFFLILMIFALNSKACFLLKLNANSSKYFIKKELKTLDLNEFNVPAESEIAHDMYPIIQRQLINSGYSEMLPGSDLAQIESGIGKTLPGNIPIYTKMTAKLPILANKINTANNQSWQYNRDKWN